MVFWIICLDFFLLKDGGAFTIPKCGPLLACRGQVPAPRLTGFEFEAPAERDCLGSLRAPIAIMATQHAITEDIN